MAIINKTNKVLIFPVFFLILLHLLLNFFCIIISFVNFGGFHNKLAEQSVNFAFHLANWPTLLLKIYPFVISLNGEVVYKGMEWMTPKIFMINVLGWGSVGLLIGLLFKKIK